MNFCRCSRMAPPFTSTMSNSANAALRTNVYLSGRLVARLGLLFAIEAGWVEEVVFLF
jgi:hypothetical protein